MNFIQSYLDSLLDDEKEIYLSANVKLTSLPNLSRFTKLEVLYCSNNLLIELPFLYSLISIMFIIPIQSSIRYQKITFKNRFFFFV